MILDSQAFAAALEEDRDNKTARQGKPKKNKDSQKMKVSTKKKVRFDDT
jgi:hypothetical protein